MIYFCLSNYFLIFQTSHRFQNQRFEQDTRSLLLLATTMWRHHRVVIKTTILFRFLWHIKQLILLSKSGKLEDLYPFFGLPVAFHVAWHSRALNVVLPTAAQRGDARVWTSSSKIDLWGAWWSLMCNVLA